MFPEEMPPNGVWRPESLGLGARRTLLVPAEALSTKKKKKQTTKPLAACKFLGPSVKSAPFI